MQRIVAGLAADRRWQLVSKVLLLTSTGETAAEILPSLSLLDHAVRLAPASAGSAVSVAGSASGPASGSPPDAVLADAVLVDAVLVDARRDMVQMRQLCAELEGMGRPVLAIVGEGGWAAVTTDWGIDDVILHSAGPGEVEARIRLAVGRASRPVADPAQEVRSGELVINEATYSARFRGTALDLTFKEFELLKFLAQHPQRVFTRSQLLQEVWGYDYFGGTRTVDVHVRRLRAKLGTDNEALIGTVRNVGYKFVPAKADSRHRGEGSNSRDETQDGSGDDGDDGDGN
jgi:DNA-binding response OmpR family regulator